MSSPSACPIVSGRAGHGRTRSATLMPHFQGLDSWLPPRTPCGPRGKLRAAGAQPKEGRGLSPVTLQVLRAQDRTGRPFIASTKTHSQLLRDQARSPQTLGHNISGNVRGLKKKMKFGLSN